MEHFAQNAHVISIKIIKETSNQLGSHCKWQIKAYGSHLINCGKAPCERFSMQFANNHEKCIRNDIFCYQSQLLGLMTPGNLFWWNVRVEQLCERQLFNLLHLMIINVNNLKTLNNNWTMRINYRRRFACCSLSESHSSESAASNGGLHSLSEEDTWAMAACGVGVSAGIVASRT